MVELRSRRIAFERQITTPILYRGVEVGMHRLDLFVADEIVAKSKLEVKRVFASRHPSCNSGPP